MLWWQPLRLANSHCHHLTLLAPPLQAASHAYASSLAQPP